ncbi:MAG: low molecular weight phosphotyrosine protein phosphatase [Rhodocyclales bacterium]|nr:low molecular weight phosphotyrosine protein phosphatase [Rhodocyclales bacterium]
MQHRILFVCTGNICRSPTAEGVARALAEKQGVGHLFEFDSAGTLGYHAGEPPDPRAIAAAAKRGYDLAPLRARQVTEEDFFRFDYVLAMDRDHLKVLQKLCPPTHKNGLSLLLDYDDATPEDEVPDPYYGGPEGFDAVLTLVENATGQLIRRLAK